MDLAPGLEISRSIRLVRKLGEGGMGSVWVADHLTLQTQVAVKFMSQQLATSGEAAARFSREASAAAQIKSPHVVQIFDHGLLDDAIPYIVMELLEGETLSGFLARNGNVLSPQVTAQIVSQVCKALSKAHARSVIHRDIKPDNIFLVESDGEVFVKLLDFGIAKQLHHNIAVTSTGAVMGTPHYMSPEQMLSSKHVDARSDLWAVGVVAYRCLTGAMPFDGETLAGIAVAIAKGEFALPFKAQGIGSLAIDSWFARALAKDPNARFATTRELAEAFAAAVAAGSSGSFDVPRWTASTLTPALNRAASEEPVDAAAPALPTFQGVAATMSGSRKRTQSLVALLGIGVVAVLGGGAFAAKLWGGESDPHESMATESSAVSAAGGPQPSPMPVPNPTNAPQAPRQGPPAEREPSPPLPATKAEVTPAEPARAAEIAVQKPASVPSTRAPGPVKRVAPRPARPPANQQSNATKAAPEVPDRGF